MTRQVQPARGFPPVHAPGAAVLILGSLPGVRSIEEQQYYAQPQNAFWRIMGAFCGAGPELAYTARLARLTEHGIALWDVLRTGPAPGQPRFGDRQAHGSPERFRIFLRTQPLDRVDLFQRQKGRGYLSKQGPAHARSALRRAPAPDPAVNKSGPRADAIRRETRALVGGAERDALAAQLSMTPAPGPNSCTNPIRTFASASRCSE